MHRSKTLFFILGMLGIVYIFAEQIENPFVVTKKKLPSISKLKEDNTQLLGNVLQNLPSLIKSVADLQEVSMQHLLSYAEGKKNCFWTCATKEELDACCTKLQQFEQRVEWMQKQVQEIVQFLKNLEK
ncbi:MAG TPA: hypothetical protein PLU71_01805 [Candidatus Dependentiae bacterium]|nr:hypothetical protein [Candidatus Dependentiae bacterium]HRQ62566.1 hypothetical protein [Candidatus Dependentiae bacterium]